MNVARTEDIGLEVLEVFGGLQARKRPEPVDDVLFLFRALLLRGLHLRGDESGARTSTPIDHAPACS